MGKLQAPFLTQYIRVAPINTTPTSLTMTSLGVSQCQVSNNFPLSLTLFTGYIPLTIIYILIF